jgi:hypothetical protein
VDKKIINAISKIKNIVDSIDPEINTFRLFLFSKAIRKNVNAKRVIRKKVNMPAESILSGI